MKSGYFKYLAVDIPLYHGLLHVAIGSDIASICRAAGLPAQDLNGLPLASFEAYAFTGIKDGVTGYFAMFRPSAAAGTVAHEALHLVHKIMFDRGLKLDPENDEAQCYLLEWVVNRINQALTDPVIKATKSITLLG